MGTYRMAVVGGVLVVLMAGGWALAQVREEKLGAMPEKVERAVVSPNGRHLAYIARSGAKESVVVDGKAEAEYDEIGEEFERSSANGPVVHFGATGGRWAFVAKKGAKRVMVVEGKVGPEFDRIPVVQQADVISADGHHSAYVGIKGQKAQVLVDGKPIAGEYSWVSGLTISADGKHVGFVGREGPLDRVFLDGKPLTEKRQYFSYGSVKLSPDGKRLAFVAGQQIGGKLAWGVGVDGKFYPGGNNVSDVVFSPDGKHVAFNAIGEGKSRVVVDGEAGPEYATIMTGIYFRSGGVTYVGRDGAGKSTVVIDGKVAAEGLNVNGLQCSASGEHVAYVVETPPGPGKVEGWVVLDGKAGAKYQGIQSMRLSPDGKRLAHLAIMGGKWMMVVDGKPGVAWQWRDEQTDIALVDPFHPAVFSGDSKHVAYVGRNGAKSFVVLDGRSGPAYDMVLRNGPSFREDGSVEYLAVKNKALYRVVQKAQTQG